MDRQSAEFQHWEILFDIRRSVRYHDHRRNHFLQIQKWFQFLHLVFGSWGVIRYLGSTASGDGQPLILLIAPAASAILSAILTAFKVTEMATRHSQLYERFIALEKEAFALSASETDSVSRIRSKVLNIEIDEPSVFHAVNIMCHNEVARSENCGAEWIHKMKPTEWILKDFCRFKRLPERLISA